MGDPHDWPLCGRYDQETGPPDTCRARMRYVELRDAHDGGVYRQWMCPFCDDYEGRDVTDELEAELDAFDRDQLEREAATDSSTSGPAGSPR